MEFTQEQIVELGLSEEQVTKVSTLVGDSINTLKGEWDGKANQQAEGILDGAVKYAQAQTGFELEREKGEKVGDFLKRYSNDYLNNEKSDLEKLKVDYEAKIKSVKGNEALTKEYEALKDANDNLLKKYADYDELKSVSEKYEPLSNEYATMKKRVAYASVKPRFADGVNEYEANAKWNEFVSLVEKDYTIEFDGDKAIAVNKENKHVVKDLKDLVSVNPTITELINGRQQKGINAKPVDFKEIEGIPFPVPENADSGIRSKLIKEYLAKEGINSMSNEYSVKFAELNNKMLQKNAK